MRLRYLLLTGTCLYMFTAWVQADTIYKWKDAHGGTHYSHTPPNRFAKTLNIKPRTTPQSTITKTQEGNAAITAVTIPQAIPGQPSQPFGSTTCNTLKQTVHTLQSGQRVFESDTNGQRTYLTDAQSAERLQRYQQYISKGCQ